MASDPAPASDPIVNHQAMSHIEALGVAIRELRRRRNNVQRHGSVNLERVGYLAELATAIAVLETLARLIESAGFS